jgi:hypothetical protein
VGARTQAHSTKPERLRKKAARYLEGSPKLGRVETATTRRDPAKSEKARLIQVLIRRRAQIEKSPFSASRRASMQAIDEVLGVLGDGDTPAPKRTSS